MFLPDVEQTRSQNSIDLLSYFGPSSNVSPITVVAVLGSENLNLVFDRFCTVGSVACLLQTATYSS